MAERATDLSHLTVNDRFTILAIDHGSGLRRQFESLGGPVTDEEILTAKLAVVRTLGARCSALLADLSLARQANFPSVAGTHQGGLLISVDEADYDDTSQPPPAIPDQRQLEEARRLGASALKVVLYYDREAGDADERCRRISDIARTSHDAGFPLLVEPLPFGTANDSTWPVDLVAGDMAACDADIVKVPLPDGEALNTLELARRITNRIASTPWILLSSGSAFPAFIEKLTMAMEGGASGFAAGRSLWGDLIIEAHNPQAQIDALNRIEKAVEVVERARISLRSDDSGTR